MSEAFTELSRRVRSLVRKGRYFITDHITKDHPERDIKKDDILEVLRTGGIVEHDPLLVDGKPQFAGRRDRYQWIGKDQKERVLSLKIVIENKIVVVHANFATAERAEAYEKEDAP
jgi:hypothetical protein